MPGPLTLRKGDVDPLDVEVCDLQLNAGDALFSKTASITRLRANRSDRVSKVVIYGYAYRWMKPESISRIPTSSSYSQRIRSRVNCSAGIATSIRRHGRSNVGPNVTG